MAELDDREVKAQLRRAGAVLANARAVRDRAKALVERNLLSEAEHEQAQAAFEIAEADARLWETRLSFTRITAPTAGIVDAKFVESGGAVTGSQLLFEISDVSIMVVRVQVSELDIVHLRPGTPATIQLDAFPGMEIEGSIRRIFPSADPVTRLVPVEVALGPWPRAIEVRAGFLARVTLFVERLRAALVVPAEAVNAGESGVPYVYVVDADTLIRRPVTLGLSSNGLVQSADGLVEGDLVVTSGRTGLRSGMTVRVETDSF